MNALRVYSVLHRACRISFLTAGLGALLAIAVYSIDIRHNAYVRLGFDRTVGLLLRDYLQIGLLAGAGIALAGIGLAAFSRTVAARLLAKLRASGGKPALATLVPALLQLLLVVAFGTALNYLGLLDWKPNRVLYLVTLGAALLVCRLLVDWLLASLAFPERHSLLASDTWFPIALVALVSSLHLVKRHHLQLLSEPELLAAVILVATVVTCLAAASRRGPAPHSRLLNTLHYLSAALLALALLTIGALALWSEYDHPSSSQAPNIILITVDTLRADHLGCYSYERPVSPSIDSLAARSTLYRRAIASSPWTLPTHASLFTGRNPYEHGVNTELRNNDTVYEPALPKDLTTLAEVLKELGYRTGAFVANSAYLGSVYRLTQGFDLYEVKRARAPALNRNAQDWIAKTSNRPFFLFINYMDTHRPYNVETIPESVDWLVDQDPGLLDQLIDEVLPADRPVPVRLAQRVVNQYDASIANLDRALGELLAWLKLSGVFEQSVIVVTSDHGEYFGEHHLVEHSKDVYEEALWIPLIVKGRGQDRGRVSDELISSTDLPRLVLSLLPGDAVRRFEHIFPDQPGSHPVISENRYTRSKDLFHPVWGDRFLRVRTAIYDWPFKLIVSSDGDHELFDLEVDPGESTNLAAAKPQVLLNLTESLHLLRVERPARKRMDSGELEISEKQLEELRSLGYL